MIGGLTASQFTFHYASTLSWESYDPFTGVWEIYIPLCFYFMGKDHGRAVSEDKFTFHYASTLCIKTGCIILITAFTFLYASTLSDTDLTPEQITELNLHSTMLLLYRKAPEQTGAWYGFTFHYASTLSACQSRHEMADLHLHSTMLLLYRLPW